MKCFEFIHIMFLIMAQKSLLKLGDNEIFLWKYNTVPAEFSEVK